MQVFGKRFNGFRPDLWPVVAFGQEKDRNDLFVRYEDGDLILFAGTTKPPTPRAAQGRLLGLAEIGKLKVDTASLIDRSPESDLFFDSAGQCTWPYSLPIIRAWRFDHPPCVRVFLAKGQKSLGFPYILPTAHLLEKNDQKKVLALAASELRLSKVPHVQNLGLRSKTTYKPRRTRSKGTLISDPEELDPKGTGRVLNAEKRRAIELYAMDWAESYYRERGYQVEDTHKNNPFDLRVMKKSAEILVEVKGTTRSGRRLRVTIGEVESARQNRTDLFVVSRIEVERKGKNVEAKGGHHNRITDWKPPDSSLQALVYEHTVRDYGRSSSSSQL